MGEGILILLILPGYVICYDIYYMLETVRYGTSFNRYIHEVRVSFLTLLKGLIIGFFGDGCNA